LIAERIYELHKAQAAFQNESFDSKKKTLNKIISILRKEYPNTKCHLNFRNPLELLVATILSAQCTDYRVNEVTKELFAKYKTAMDYANLKPQELEKTIRPTGLFRNKARAIINCCKVLGDKYGGSVPSSMGQLIELDGVGRKTANVVLGNYFKIPGIIVDTHVRRLAKKLALSDKTNPDKIERDFEQLIPRKEWTFFSNALSDHGRMICKARKPRCGMCKISHLCPSVELN
jgi:endonuclease-3